jgi:hypothetical protein
MAVGGGSSPGSVWWRRETNCSTHVELRWRMSGCKTRHFPSPYAAQRQRCFYVLCRKVKPRQTKDSPAKRVLSFKRVSVWGSQWVRQSIGLQCPARLLCESMRYQGNPLQSDASCSTKWDSADRRQSTLGHRQRTEHRRGMHWANGWNIEARAKAFVDCQAYQGEVYGPVVIWCTTRFNTSKFYILSTFIYILSSYEPRKKNNNFPTHDFHNDGSVFAVRYELSL